MESIFDDEEQQLYRRTRQVMPMLAPTETGSGYLMPSTSPTMERAMYRIDDKRKRSRVEALARLYSIRTPDLQNTPYWVQRRARPLLMIYNAAWWGAVGLVIVDPLDRLEGVI